MEFDIQQNVAHGLVAFVGYKTNIWFIREHVQELGVMYMHIPCTQIIHVLNLKSSTL